MILAPELNRVMVTARSKKNVAQMSRSIDVLLYMSKTNINHYICAQKFDICRFLKNAVFSNKLIFKSF